MLEKEFKVTHEDNVDDVEPESLITSDPDRVKLFNKDLGEHEVWKLKNLEIKSHNLLLKLISQLKDISYPKEESMISKINSIILHRESKEKNVEERRLKIEKCLFENPVKLSSIIAIIFWKSILSRRWRIRLVKNMKF